MSLRTATRRLGESFEGWRHRRAFDDVQVYCMFIGYPRSGHSLVGALLDAHPNVLITHELDALGFLAPARRMTRDRMFWLIAEADRASAQRRGTMRYDYSVPDQWQGRYEDLRVIGDKMGRKTTLRLDRRPDLLTRLEATVGVPVRLIHVVRNPYDNISTLSVREDCSLAEAADRYFALCEANERIRRREDATVLDLRHEDAIDDPAGALAGVCRYLGVDPSPGYLAACASIVYRSPHRSRTEQPWTPELIEAVRRRMQPFGFLDGYAFDDVPVTEGTDA